MAIIETIIEINKNGKEVRWPIFSKHLTEDAIKYNTPQHFGKQLDRLIKDEINRDQTTS